jgi:NADH-quinone oxidoreductase subunit I
MLKELGRGLVTTFKMLLEGPVTTQYPEQKRQVRPRFRGVTCSNATTTGWRSASAVRCVRRPVPRTPSLWKSSENTDDERFSPGDRYASTYEINMLRCIYCGYL